MAINGSFARSRYYRLDAGIIPTSLFWQTNKFFKFSGALGRNFLFGTTRIFKHDGKLAKGKMIRNGGFLNWLLFSSGAQQKQQRQLIREISWWRRRVHQGRVITYFAPTLRRHGRKGKWAHRPKKLVYTGEKSRTWRQKERWSRFRNWLISTRRAHWLAHTSMEFRYNTSTTYQKEVALKLGRKNRPSFSTNGYPKVRAQDP